MIRLILLCGIGGIIAFYSLRKEDKPKPVVDAPVTDTAKPNTPEPVAAKQPESESPSPKPAPIEPVGPKPVVAEPSAPKLAPVEPVMPKPVVAEPVAPKPAPVETVMPKPVVAEPSAPKPAPVEPVMPNPVVSPPVAPSPPPVPVAKVDDPAPVPPKPAGVSQSPIQLASFKKDVLARIEDADSETFTEEMKEGARNSVKDLRNLLPISTIYFAKDTTVDSKGGPSLEDLKKELVAENIQKILTDIPKSAFIILGFADASGSMELNRKLTKSRAEFIKNYVQEVHKKLEKDRIVPLGVGVTNVMGTQDVKKNRAVEVWLAIPKS